MNLLKRFWASLILSLPMLLFMIEMTVSGMKDYHKWISFVLTTFIIAINFKYFFRSSWRSFIKRRANMDTLITMGTSIAYIYSVFAIFTDRPIYFESAAFILVFVLLGQVIEQKIRENASNSIEKMLNVQAKTATVIRENKESEVDIEDVAVGDLIKVRAGEKIPVDGVVVDGGGSIDESAITGESLPVLKKKDSLVIGSTVNLDGVIYFRASKIGKDTMFGQIIEFVNKAQNSKAPIQKIADDISNIFVPVVLILSILTFILWYIFLNSNISDAILYAVAVLVIACPCALGLAIPTALMVGVNKSARNGVLIKNGTILEEMNKIDVVVFDKTGTLTKGIPKVSKIIGGDSVLMIAAALEQNSTHPIGVAIMNELKKQSLELLRVEDFKSNEGYGVSGYVNGERAYIGSYRIIEDNNFKIDNKILKESRDLQKQSNTVSYVCKNNAVIGLIAIQDEIRDESINVVKTLRNKNIETIMITGDNHGVAEYVGDIIGVDKVVANVLPQDKAIEISKIQKSGKKVAFVGDGINDAPALTTADIGISMGSGSDIAVESGDVILVENNLNSVLKAMNFSKKTFSRIKINLFWALFYNVIGIPITAGLFKWIGVGLSPELAGLFMAFSSISVVLSSLALNYSRDMKS